VRPFTAASPLPINPAIGRNAICVPLPNAAASRSSALIRRRPTDRIERKKVMALAQARDIDAILVTELSRWGRSTIDLVQTLQSLQAWDVSVLAVSGLQFDLSTPHGKMIASVMAALAEFERDLIRERIKSGIAAAKARGKRLGRQPGQRPSDRKAPKVIKLAEAGLSYRLIGRHVGLSKNTVGAILHRARAAKLRKKA
jgi:DNA invertase Pin-like site-specific DNA recombinase